MTVDANIIDLFGPVPDGLDLSESNATHMDVGIITLIVVALVSVVLRFGARFVQKAERKSDDYLMIVALLCAITTCILVGEIVQAGAGKHVWALTTDEVVHLTKILYAVVYVYTLAIWTLKASIVFLYARLFLLNDTIFRLSIYASAFIGTSICLATFIVFATACQPLTFFWTRFEPDAEGFCIDIGTSFIGIAFVNVFLDFFLLAIPIPRVLLLQMTARKKFIVIASLLLGIFVCVAGLMRIYYIFIFRASMDYSWTLAPVCMWLAMEPAIGIVTTCLPNMLPLYYWCCTRVGLIREGNETKHHISSGNNHNRTQGFPDGGHQRLPTYIENNMVLRPKEDDEICLTTMATAARNESNESVEVLGHGILVRSEVTQTVESGGVRSVRSL